MTAQPSQSGFTLLEIAVVLVIVGVLLAGALQPLRASLEQARESRVKADLARARDALLGYAASRALPHLPCPDCRGPACVSAGNLANDGLEDRDAGSGRCDADDRLGNLPWATLALPEADPWGSRYAYRVAPDYADAGRGFDLDTGVSDTLSIDTRDTADRVRPLLSNLPLILLSHGPNARGALGADGRLRSAAQAGQDENENLDSDRRYFSAAARSDAAGSAGGSFDDRLGWLGVYELKAFSIRAGRLP